MTEQAQHLPVRLTLVYDDFAGAVDGFQPAFGFSLVVEIAGRKILFDTGTEPEILMANLAAAKLAPTDLAAIILSHDHYDHSGGLSAVLEAAPHLPVFVHDGWDAPNTSKGPPVTAERRVTLAGGTWLPEVAPGLYVTRAHPSPDYNGTYEHALCVVTGRSVVLLTGCCHPGLDVFIDEVDRVTGRPELPLHILGGLHGFRFSDERARALAPRIAQLTCCHCTKSPESFVAQFKDRCGRLRVGETLQLGLLG